MKNILLPLLWILGAPLAFAQEHTFDCRRPLPPIAKQAEAQCQLFQAFPKSTNEPVTREAEEQCLAFYSLVAEARQLICSYQAASEKLKFPSESSEPKEQEGSRLRAHHAAKLAEKLRDLVAERDRYFLSINKLGALAGRTFLDEARGESIAGMSSAVPSLLLSGAAQKSLDQLQYSSKLMVLALRWTAGDAKGQRADLEKLNRQLADALRLSPLPSPEKTKAPATTTTHEQENVIAVSVRTHAVDHVARIAAEHPIERLMELVAESQLGHALPTATHAAARVLPSLAGAAVVIAFEAAQSGGHLEPLDLAAVGAGAAGGFAVSVAAQVAKTAYRNYQAQQAYLEEYRHFAARYLKEHLLATSYEVSQAFHAQHSEKQAESAHTDGAGRD